MICPQLAQMQASTARREGSYREGLRENVLLCGNSKGRGKRILFTEKIRLQGGLLGQLEGLFHRQDSPHLT